MSEPLTEPSIQNNLQGTKGENGSEITCCLKWATARRRAARLCLLSVTHPLQEFQAAHMLLCARRLANLASWGLRTLPLWALFLQVCQAGIVNRWGRSALPLQTSLGGLWGWSRGRMTHTMSCASYSCGCMKLFLEHVSVWHVKAALQLMIL